MIYSLIHLCISSLWEKVDETFIKNIHKKILYNVRPDITILLKVNIKKVILRVKNEDLKIDMINYPNRFIGQPKMHLSRLQKSKIIIYLTHQMMIMS